MVAAGPLFSVLLRPLPSLSSCLCCRGVESDIEQVMQKHREMQDKIAEDMLKNASALKHNILAAQSIIEKDAEVGVGWGEGAVDCL